MIFKLSTEISSFKERFSQDKRIKSNLSDDKISEFMKKFNSTIEILSNEVVDKKSGIKSKQINQNLKV